MWLRGVKGPVPRVFLFPLSYKNNQYFGHLTVIQKRLNMTHKLHNILPQQLNTIPHLECSTLKTMDNMFHKNVLD